MTVKAKIIHSENLARHLVAVMTANAGLPVDQLPNLIENAIRKIIQDSGEQNNAVVVVGEKGFDERYSYPYFSFLPDDKKLIV